MCAVVVDRCLQLTLVVCCSGDKGGGGWGGLRVKLLGWGLLIGCTGGFSLSEVVAALVLLPHAVDQEEDEEDGEQEANDAAGNHS